MFIEYRVVTRLPFIYIPAVYEGLLQSDFRSYSYIVPFKFVIMTNVF